MENILLIGIYANIADTIWSSPAYHGGAYESKLWSVVIIIAHQWFLGPLIAATSLE